MGTPAATMISLQNALEPSRRAASLEGPKQRIFASESESTTPATSGASGPTTTRSGVMSRAAPRTAPGSPRSSGRVSASRAMPTLPGAHTILGLARRARQRVDDRVLARAGAEDEDRLAHVGAAVR